MAIYRPTAVLDFEVTERFPEQHNLSTYGEALVLCRVHGRPLGWVRAPIVNGALAVQDVIRGLCEKHASDLTLAVAERAIDSGCAPAWVEVEALVGPPADRSPVGPLVTVAVCTRNRATDLRRCLDALGGLEYPHVDVLVVDNAPSDDRTARLVRNEFPSARYVVEPRPGLDWARNRAILETRGEIIAFTDDDVVVDPAWVSTLVSVFLADPEVTAVTGLVTPHELDTESQQLFEIYGGFGRGFRRRWFRGPRSTPLAALHAGTGKFGTGANMAFRRRVFDEVGGFDPALDVGTVTNGGGDLEMFFRVLKAGHTLVYEPSAIVRHRHRATYAALREQIANNGVGLYSYIVRETRAYPDERLAFARFGAYWLWWWSVRRLARGLLRKERVPLDLTVAELGGSIRGLRRYRRARIRAGEVARQWATEPTFPAPTRVPLLRRSGSLEAVRNVDLANPLKPIDDAREFERLRVLVSWGGAAIGVTYISHHGARVTALWLRDEIAQQLGVELLDARASLGSGVTASAITAGWAKYLLKRARATDAVNGNRTEPRQDIPVSIVIATYDRPDDLVRCLESLLAQRTARPLDIVVVDNHPSSGVTRAAIAPYGGVRLVEEDRAGLSYARNRGIAAARGEIIVTTDDDVVCPPEWLERLLCPFTQADVMVVTGNVLALEIDSDAQRLFEAYGGLSRGFTRARADGRWFVTWRRAVPTWELGCTANAAFRASIFKDPAIGLMDEALGAGTPTGCSEDTYAFYRVLKAGYAIAYEPDAFVWHRHRTNVRALRRQIYSYSKGHVAYQLTTLLRERDPRALVRLGYELPRIYARRAWERVSGRSEYPLWLVATEILGCMAGPFALWRSRRRVRRLGRSTFANGAGDEASASRSAA